MSDEVEIEVPSAPEGVSEVMAVDPASEIVYLYCTLKDPNVRRGQDGKPFQTEVTKAGEHDFVMRAGQVAQMKRSIADWHVAKTASFDAIHFHLKLEVKTVKEMEAIKRVLEAQAKAKAAGAEDVAKATRKALEEKAVAAGMTKKDAAAASDADLEALTA